MSEYRVTDLQRSFCEGGLSGLAKVTQAHLKCGFGKAGDGVGVPSPRLAENKSCHLFGALSFVTHCSRVCVGTVGAGRTALQTLRRGCVPSMGTCVTGRARADRRASDGCALLEGSVRPTFLLCLWSGQIAHVFIFLRILFFTILPPSLKSLVSSSNPKLFLRWGQPKFICSFFFFLSSFGCYFRAEIQA